LGLSRPRLTRALVCFGWLVLSGCSAKPVDLGRDPDILWWTDHETGDLSDWQQGQYSSWLDNNGSLAVDTQQARSGHFALDTTAVAAPSGTTSAAMLLRTGGLPEAAYYSAWFYVPAGIASAEYWMIFKFRSRTPDPNPADVELWDIDLTPQTSDVQIRIFHHTSTSDPGAGSRLDPIAPVSIPLGRWFQVEAFLRAVNDDSGELMLWQDGILLYDVQGPSAPSSYVQWSAGCAAKSLSAGDAHVYVDDAAVSLRRLGPDFPPFWRGE
jgi:hypothetical protein